MILLVRPPPVEYARLATTSIALPLGLAYIAGALESAGGEVRVVDAVADAPSQFTRYSKGFLVGLTLEEIADRVPEKVDFVGISAIFTHEWPIVVRLIQLIKERRPNAFVVVGGEHVTAMPEFSLMTSQADALVLGEGEETVIELWQAMRKRKPLAGVPGVAFREGDRIQVNARRVRKKDVDSIPLPAWHLFDIAKYHAHRLSGGLYTGAVTVPILSTRGCPYQCTYCSSPNMWTTSWIPRTPAKVVDEIEHYVKTYGAGNFPFEDLTAIIRKDWVVAFCKEILNRGLKITWQFPTGTRCEVVDTEVARLLKQSGMVSMNYAPESGSDETRKLIKKQMPREKLFKSIEAATREGLNVSLFLVLGFPHDTKKSLSENLGFLDSAAKSGVTDLSLGFYMALPGTELFNSLYDAGKIRIDQHYFRHILHGLAFVPTQSYSDSLSRLDLTLWKIRLYRRFYGNVRGSGGLFSHVWRGLSGLFQGDGHDTKLQTAFRNGAANLWTTVKVWLSGRRWISGGEERALLRDWDVIFRSVREQRAQQGVTPLVSSNASEIQSKSVVPLLRKEHEQPRTLVDTKKRAA